MNITYKYEKQVERKFKRKYTFKKTTVMIALTVAIITVVLSILLTLYNLNLIGKKIKHMTYEIIQQKIEYELDENRKLLFDNMKNINEYDIMYETIESQDKKNTIMKEINNKLIELEGLIKDDIKLEDDIKEEFDYVISKKGYHMNIENVFYLIDTANKYDLDPHFIIGLYQLESGFNPNASNSKSTARGYGQFLHSTAKWVYEDILKKGEYYSHDLAFDPEINIELTCAYLNYLMEQTDGDYMKSLLLYNGYELGERYYHIIDKNMRINVGYGIGNI